MSFDTTDSRFGTSGEQRARQRGKFFGRVVPVFGLMLLVTGLVIGGMATTGAAKYVAGLGLVGYIGLLVVQVAVFYAARATREYFPFNAVFAFAFAAFEGVFLTPFVVAFLSNGLGTVLAEAFVVTSVAFVGLAAYPYLTGKDFGFLGPFLFASVLGLVAISVLSFFVGFPGWVGIAVDVASVVIFSLFVLYDMSAILEDRMGAVTGAMSLYLDFVILFVNIAQLLAAFQE